MHAQMPTHTHLQAVGVLVGKRPSNKVQAAVQDAESGEGQGLNPWGRRPKREHQTQGKALSHKHTLPPVPGQVHDNKAGWRAVNSQPKHGKNIRNPPFGIVSVADKMIARQQPRTGCGGTIPPVPDEYQPWRLHADWDDHRHYDHPHHPPPCAETRPR
jgi:hypothetical protein